MLDLGQSFWGQVRSGVQQIWNWLPKAGVFSVGFFVGSAFFKPVVDLFAAIESRRKAAIELKRTRSDSYEHLRTIDALRAALSEANAKIAISDSRRKEVGLQRYVVGTCLGLVLGGATAVVFYFHVPLPAPVTPTAKFAEGYELGYADGLIVRKKRMKTAQIARSSTSLSTHVSH